MNAATKIVSVKIGNVINEGSNSARAIVAAIHGQTYMNLQVKFAPAYGSCDVWVESDYPENTEADLMEMVMGQMIRNLKPAT